MHKGNHIGALCPRYLAGRPLIFLIRVARRRGGRGGSPKRLYKAPTYYTKPLNIIQTLQNSMQNPKILDKNPKYLARAATNNMLAKIIKHPILKTQNINNTI